MNPSKMITHMIEWDAIKEAIVIIERSFDLQTQLEQLKIISKYSDELRRTVKYDIEHEHRFDGCCGEL